MLPAHIRQLLEEQIETDLRSGATSDRDLFQKAAVKNIQRGGHGMDYGIQATTIFEEIELRGGLISGAIKKVVSDVKIAPYQTLVADLVAVFDARFEATDNALRPKILKAISHGPGGGGGSADHLSRKIATCCAVNRMEVKRLGSAIMEPALRSNTVSISFQNSQVGVIQTGDQSVVGTGIAISNHDSAEVVKALQEIKERLGTLEHLDPSKRAELREVVTDVESELAKPKPNKTRIGALLTAVLAAIKNVETVTKAYEIIAKFLGNLGFHMIS